MTEAVKKAAQKTTRVLVVDDEAAVAELIQAFLGSAGLEAVVMTNSREAGERLLKEKFDVVFMDVHMPKPDGIELARLMRAAGFNQSTPLVMLTGADDLALQRKAFEAGANFFLFKPIDRPRLLRVVRTTQGSVQQEKRRFQRVPVSCKVSLATQQAKLEGTTMDISLGGFQARMQGVFPLRTSVAVFLDLGHGAPVRGKGWVVRVIEDHTMGIQLRDLTPADSERLQEFLLPHILKITEPEAARR